VISSHLYQVRMTEYLVFRLFGPMASFGDVAVGQVRPSFDHPSKSAVLGLIGAALGVKRDEEEVHCAMADGYGFSVMLTLPGMRVVDFHTAQAPHSRAKKNAPWVQTRSDELQVDKNDIETILSRREYLCDMVVTVCLWCTNDKDLFSLTAIRDALISPKFVLYLGRKSCPVSLPVQAQIIEAPSVMSAYDMATFDESLFSGVFRFPDTVRVFYEADCDAGFTGIVTEVRQWDQVRSRKRWQFSERREKSVFAPAPVRRA